MKDNDTRAAEELFPSGHQPPSDYHRSPQYARIVCDKDVAVAMRDGVTVVVDVYRPDAAGRFPVLFAFGVHSKELQGNELPKIFRHSPPGRRSGSAMRKRVTPSSSYRAAMCT